jgi:hypothetical protein
MRVTNLQVVSGCTALLQVIAPQPQAFRHVGGMDIFWGRQALGCHGIYYALLLSALHEGMITLLVCLSSYLYLNNLTVAAQALGLSLSVVEVHSADELADR